MAGAIYLTHAESHEGDAVAPFLLDGDKRVGWIPLGTKPGDPCIVSLPEAQPGDARLTKLADSPTDVSRAARSAFSSRLGLNLFDDKSCSDLIAELLMDHGREDGRGHRGIRACPSVERLQHEIYLGADEVSPGHFVSRLIWSATVPPMKHSTGYTETFPSVGSITSGQDLGWTEQQNTGTVASGNVRVGTPGTTFGVFQSSNALHTGNQYHRAEYAIASNVGGINFASVLCRHSDVSNYYRFFVLRNNGTFQRQTLKRVAAANTVFVNDTTDPGATGAMMYVVDGATITGYIGTSVANLAVTHGPTTDGSPALTTNLNCGLLIRATTTAGDCTMDNLRFADVGFLFGFVAADMANIANMQDMRG